MLCTRLCSSVKTRNHFQLTLFKNINERKTKAYTGNAGRTSTGELLNRIVKTFEMTLAARLDTGTKGRLASLTQQTKLLPL